MSIKLACFVTRVNRKVPKNCFFPGDSEDPITKFQSGNAIEATKHFQLA